MKTHLVIAQRWLGIWIILKRLWLGPGRVNPCSLPFYSCSPSNSPPFCLFKFLSFFGFVFLPVLSLKYCPCWQCHVLPAAMSKTASRSGAGVPPPLLDLLRSKSQLYAFKRLQDPGTQVFFFFPNQGLLRALRWKRPLVVCWTLRSHGELAPPKILEKKEEVPR